MTNPGLRYSCYQPLLHDTGAQRSGRWRVDDLVCAFNQIALRYTDLFPRQPDEVERVTGRAPVPRHLREVLHVGASAFRF